MKKVLLVVASILFAGGLYVNFTMEPSTEQADLMNETGTSDENTGDDADGQDEDLEDDSENGETGEEEAVEVESEPEPEVSFNQENLNAVYEEMVQNNEALIIDVLLTKNYSEDFMDDLEEAFGTGTIQFNRLDLDANSTNLSEITINENSDAVIMDALQIQDYDDEVLPARDETALATAYMSIYNNDKTVFLLGNADVYEDPDLAAVLEEDEEFFTGNDYYYIDNQNVEVDEATTSEIENEIIGNIHDYLISE